MLGLPVTPFQVAPTRRVRRRCLRPEYFNAIVWAVHHEDRPVRVEGEITGAPKLAIPGPGHAPGRDEYATLRECTDAVIVVVRHQQPPGVIEGQTDRGKHIPL